MSQGSRTIAVAMSGGLDSSMAATLLVEAGHECIGIMMRLWSEPGTGKESSNKCCSSESVDVAREVAERLDMPFYLINVEEIFKREVVDPFIVEYMAGQTPNPCLNCNRHIRFTYLLQYAAQLGLGRLATGHHARVDTGPDGQARLLRARDLQKDQSYVLSVLDQERLQRVIFPVGEYLKPDLRTMARHRNLPVADKDESMDLCFVADNNYKRFLADWGKSSNSSGPILTTDGQEVGQHGGLYNFTIGQRRGLNLPNLTGNPLYVIDKLKEQNAVVVGSQAELRASRSQFSLMQANWNQGHPPNPDIPLSCQIRYRGAAHACELIWDNTEVPCVRMLDNPTGIAPGQAAVFYDGEVCLGGGIIGA